MKFSFKIVFIFIFYPFLFFVLLHMCVLCGKKFKIKYNKEISYILKSIEDHYWEIPDKDFFLHLYFYDHYFYQQTYSDTLFQ